MKNSNSKLPFNSARDIILIPLGSTPILVAQALRMWEKSRGLKAEDWVKVVAFDAQDVQHHQALPAVDEILEKVKLMSSEIIRGVIGDPETRYKAEKRGLLWMADPGFYKDPGVAGENIGVGGNSRIGRVLFALNRNTFASLLTNRLRQCQDYHQQQLRAYEKICSVRMQPVIEVLPVVSFVGGTGTGAFPEVVQMIADKAAELKANVKITPIILLVGTLNPGDRHMAARNQQMALKGLQARLEGKFKDLTCSNGDYQILCNPPILFSNANNWGEIADLPGVYASLGHYLYLFSHTSFGPQFRQKTINLHSSEPKDELDGLRSCATFGHSVINLNKEKISAYSGCQLAHTLFTSLLKDQDSSGPVQLAAATASALSIRETYHEDEATQRLFCLHRHGGLNAQERARSFFREQSGNRSGFRGCRDIYQAARQTLNSEIPGFLVPKMGEETTNWLSECAKVVNNEISGYLEKQSGLTEGPRFLEHLEKLLGQFEESNQHKLRQAQDYNKDIRKRKSACEKIYNKLRKTNWLFRLFSFSAKAIFRREYPRHVEALIQNELEIAARKILARKVFGRIHKIINGQSGRLTRITNNVVRLCDQLYHEAGRLKNLPDQFYAPVGCELADAPFMDQMLNKIIGDEGGESKTNRKLFDTFLGEYDSLDAFSQQDSEKIKDFLVKYSRDLAQGCLTELNVLDVFQHAFSTEEAQHEQVGRLIAQSDGRVKISGQGDEDIARAKFVCGPDPRAVQWGVKIANKIYPHGGDWQGVVDQGLSGTVFAQYRAQVCLTQQIRDIQKVYKVSDDPEELVQIGEDPLIAFAPPADCNDNEIKTTIAQGLVAKKIYQGEQSYQLKTQHEPIVLGNSLNEIQARLSHDYHQRMQIYREFCLELTKRRQEVLKEIDGIIANVSNGSNGWLVSEVGARAFVRLKGIAEVLMPHVKRMVLL